jgi:hypothetical protein
LTMMQKHCIIIIDVFQTSFLYFTDRFNNQSKGVLP